MHEHVKEILLSEKELDTRVSQIGEMITQDYRGQEIVLVGIMKGAVIFFADLARKINCPVTMDFMAISSYGASTKSSGVVKIVKDLDRDIMNKHVIIVEDIIDSGLTLAFLKENLLSRGAKSLRLCVLLDKVERRKVKIDVDYCGFSIPDEFVVGYGLDYAENYRHLPYIGVLKPEIYTNVK